MKPSVSTTQFKQEMKSDPLMNFADNKQVWMSFILWLFCSLFLPCCMTYPCNCFYLVCVFGFLDVKLQLVTTELLY